MSSIKSIQEALLEFNSCNSTLDSSSSDEMSEPMAERKGKRKKKDKKIHNRSEFLKKPNNKTSPK